jgi:hypothetical protein
MMTETMKLAGGCGVTKEWLLAGPSIFTVHNAADAHYTFKVKLGHYDRLYGQAYWVSMLSGPDNAMDEDYTYLGSIDGNGEFFMTGGSRLPMESTAVRVLKFALQVIFEGREMPPGYGVLQAAPCSRCGKLMSTPESLYRGVGPVCYEKMMAGL